MLSKLPVRLVDGSKWVSTQVVAWWWTKSPGFAVASRCRPIEIQFRRPAVAVAASHPDRQFAGRRRSQSAATLPLAGHCCCYCLSLIASHQLLGVQTGRCYQNRSSFRLVSTSRSRSRGHFRSTGYCLSRYRLRYQFGFVAPAASHLSCLVIVVGRLFARCCHLSRCCCCYLSQSSHLGLSVGRLATQWLWSWLLVFCPSQSTSHLVSMSPIPRGGHQLASMIPKFLDGPR